MVFCFPRPISSSCKVPEVVALSFLYTFSLQKLHKASGASFTTMNKSRKSNICPYFWSPCPFLGCFHTIHVLKLVQRKFSFFFMVFCFPCPIGSIYKIPEVALSFLCTFTLQKLHKASGTSFTIMNKTCKSNICLTFGA